MVIKVKLDIGLKPVTVDEKEILRNLLEKYNYEFSQWEDTDVNALGLYGYNYLDNYWTEKNRWAYFIIVGDKLAGFVMVNNFAVGDAKDVNYSMAEFFVMHKYRRGGVGRFAATTAFDLHRGKWQLKMHPRNTTAVKFWINTISDYTNGDFELHPSHPAAEYDDGTYGDIIFFEN